jgi:glycosyltransferase involved in cell wall biosynthesis
MTESANTELATGDALSAIALPRVLILSGEIPQTRNAGAIVLYRLLRGYGLEARGESEQAEATGSHASGARRQATGGRRQTVDGESTEPKAKLFVIGPKAHAEAELLDCPYRELQMPLARFDNTRFSVLKRSLTACRLTPLPSHRKIMSLLGAFRPEVLVCVMIDTPWMLTAERTAKKLGIPLVVIVHDINEEFEKVFPWAKKALFRKNRDVYRSAARRLCVSPEMAEFLEKRYGVPGEVMYPNRSEGLQPRAAELSLTLRSAADQETKRLRDERSEEDESDFDKGNFDILKDPPPATGNSLHTSAPLTLGYAGSLAYGYGEALVELIPVLREVGARILLSTPRPPENLKALLEATDVVEWMPHRADINEMWRMMQERADVMILPYMNPAGSNRLLYRTHFPSKLPEYLALGMPVIVSGPEFATGLRYAQAEKLTTGAEGRAGEPAEGSPKGDTSGAREATSNKLKLQSFQDLPKGRLAEPRLSVSEFLDFAPNGAVPCARLEELVASLGRLKLDGKLRKQLAEHAVEAALRDFDPGEIREAFVEALREAAGESGHNN